MERKKAGFALVVLGIFLWAINLPVFAADTHLIADDSKLIIIGSGDFDYKDGRVDEAAFRFPNGLAYAKKAEAIIIADTQNHCIRSLNLKSLEVTTVAGKSQGLDRFGFPGGGYLDGGVKEAMFSHPKGLVAADNGAIIIADTNNHAIRQIYQGQVTTIAGGTMGYQDGQALKAYFNKPTAIAIGKDDNLFVADTLNNVIRKIDLKGNVTTYAGKPDDTSILNEPTDLVADKEGNLYVIDSGNHQVKKITAQDTLEVVAGNKGVKDTDSNYWLGGYLNGPTKIAYFNFPKGITLKANDTLYIADSYNHVIREVSSDMVTTVAGTNLAGEKLKPNFLSQFDGPTKLVYAKDSLFIADQWNNRIILIPDKNHNLKPITNYLTGTTSGEIKVILDGNIVAFPDLAPLEIGETIKIPIRALTEAWGANIEWTAETQEFTILKDGKIIGFAIEAEDFIIYQDRSLVALDTIRGKLGWQVNWLPEQNIIAIQSK
ncbi:MAG: hypothetical protein GX333_03240 [Syntrophomonadaceae bacterium]|nr:hypothetical protein [Syntrophomonadaceae bacterium]